MSEKIKKAIQNGTLFIDYVGGAGNISYLLNHYRNLQCKYHVLLDNDDAGRLAFETAESQGLIKEKNVTFTICNNSPNAEIEDCFDKKAYSSAIWEEFGVDLSVREFRGNKKWSDRIANCFKSQGKQWNSTIEKKVKLTVANVIPPDDKKALNSHKRSAIDALVVALDNLMS